MANNDLKPVYFFYGADAYLIEEEVKSIKAEAMGKSGMDSLNTHIFHANTMDTAEVISEAMTLPAMSPKRLVIVKGADALKGPQQKELIPYIEDPSITTCLVFISAAAKVSGTSAFFKLLDKSGYLVRKSTMRDSEIERWIRREVKGAGKEITPAAVKKLVAIAGKGLGEIKGELEKTILFVGEAPAIEEDDVESAGIDVREESVFALADAIGAKDAGGAIRVYSKLTNEVPLMLLGSIVRQFRIIMKVKALGRSGTPRAKLAAAVGVYSTYIDKYIQSSSRFTEDELSKAFARLSIADLELKGGGASMGTGLPPKLVMTRLIMELCG